MEKEIVVRKYSDLKPYFENKSLQNQIQVNQLFINEFEKSFTQVQIDLKKAKNFAQKAVKLGGIANEMKSGKSSLEAVLTPKMTEALKNGTGKLCEAHKDGNIFSKIQYADGSSEFISLKEVKGSPNFTNIQLLVNQAQMQQTLTDIQNLLIDFAEETDRQLVCLQRDNHDNRMLKSETVKLNFESYRKGMVSLDNLTTSINEAFPAVAKEMKVNLKDLKELSIAINEKRTSFGMKKMIEKEQTYIKYILEGLTQFQVLGNIEMFLRYELDKDESVENKERNMMDVQKRYCDVLIENFGSEELELLSGLSILPKDIWRESVMPGIEKLNANMKEVVLCQNSVQENIMGLELK